MPTSQDYRKRVYRDYLSHKNLFDPQKIVRELKSRAPYLRRIIRKWFPQDRKTRILDLGCGYGAFLHVLREAGYERCTGMDGSEEQVNMAKKLEIAEVENKEIEESLQSFSSSAFDIVIAFDVLEHFPKSRIFMIMDEVFRILRPGGAVILHVPNGEAIFSCRSYGWDITHEVVFTQESIRQLVSSIGFSKVCFEEDAPVIHGAASLIRFFFWKLFRAFFWLIHLAETGEWKSAPVFSQNLLAIAEKEDLKNLSK